MARHRIAGGLFTLALVALAGCGGDGDTQPPRPTLLFSMTAAPLGRGDIFLLDEHGKLRNLTRTADPEELSPSWSPDGRQIVFAAKYETPAGAIRDELFPD
jgi:hypothetical protein